MTRWSSFLLSRVIHKVRPMHFPRARCLSLTAEKCMYSWWHQCRVKHVTLADWVVMASWDGFVWFCHLLSVLWQAFGFSPSLWMLCHSQADAPILEDDRCGCFRGDLQKFLWHSKRGAHLHTFSIQLQARENHDRMKLDWIREVLEDNVVAWCCV